MDLERLVSEGVNVGKLAQHKPYSKGFVGVQYIQYYI